MIKQYDWEERRAGGELVASVMHPDRDQQPGVSYVVVPNPLGKGYNVTHRNDGRHTVLRQAEPTLDDAQAFAEQTARIVDRREAWRAYMDEHDPPSFDIARHQHTTPVPKATYGMALTRSSFGLNPLPDYVAPHWVGPKPNTPGGI